MGNAFKCLCGKKTLSAREFHFGQIAIHNTLRRSMEQIIKMPDEMSAEKFYYFARYVQLFRGFLVVHHTQEDRYIFPQSCSKSNKENLFGLEKSEHKEIGPLLDKLSNIVEEVVDPTVVQQENILSKLCEIKSIVQTLQSLVLPHLEREEKILTENFYTAYWDEEELRQLNSDIHEMPISS